MMNNYISLPLPCIYFGKGAVKNLKALVSKYGNKVLLVYGKSSIKRNGIYDSVMKELEDADVFELSGVEPNPRISTVQKGVDICRKEQVEVVVAVGGGSVIDCSKAITAGSFFEGDDLWEMIRTKAKTKAVLPLICILTTAATGSESNKGYVISNEKTLEKIGSSNPLTMPKATIMDPEFTYSLDPYQTASGIVDIMAHVFESYFKSTSGAYLQDRFAEAILKTVIHYGPIAYQNPFNYEARANLMAASSWALNGLVGNGKSGTSSCHPIEHALSAVYDITHGVGLRIVTIPWMNYILSDKTVDKFAMYGRNVWEIKDKDDMTTAKEAIMKTEMFYQQFDLPQKLSDLNIDESHFEEMAKKAVAAGLSKAYVPLDEQDVIQILKHSL